MSWLTATFVVLLACVAGFVGIAVLSTVAGQYLVAGTVCVIATYWLALANGQHSAH